MEQYKIDTNSPYAFYKSEIIDSPGNKITGKKLYEAYVNWCKDNYIAKPVSIQTFGKQMKSFGVKWDRKTAGITYFDIDIEFEVVDDIENPFDNVRQFKKC